MTHEKAIAEAAREYRAIHLYVVELEDGTFGVAESYKVGSDGIAELGGKRGIAKEHFFRGAQVGKFLDVGVYRFGAMAVA